MKGEHILTFKNFFIDYTRFHSNTMNKVVNLIFIPLLFLSFVCFMKHFHWDVLFDFSNYVPNISFVQKRSFTDVEVS